LGETRPPERGQRAIIFEKEIFFAKKSLFQKLSLSEGFFFPLTLFVAALCNKNYFNYLPTFQLIVSCYVSKKQNNLF
jgi:hypothetical protein